ncbi:hypothetical protein OZX74_04425 [Bifidobacterium sp. ESL0798]|uniref:hypothetical protein n=1 Tax=Bifidobacterium sp. ESL0798 TaxID=2983235 RepID=UPI0023F7359E|nr:hypothetical protein [Bifidobacterium sp. ESL0798]WEV74763.1 hypothetical protein OZX74_04425 [Bifidobacterium sp. ESL0798]
MTATKKPVTKSKGKIVGKLKTAADIVQLIEQIIPPEQVKQVVGWLKDQQFSDKFIELTKKIHFQDKHDLFAKVENQCDAVEELIRTRSSMLADDAPISAWRVELEKIRTGTELVKEAKTNDTKKIKALEKRASKLYNSVFIAVIGK